MEVTREGIETPIPLRAQRYRYPRYSPDGRRIVYETVAPSPLRSLPADASSTQANVATITFDVVVDPTVVDGTVISNQGFVSTVSGGVTDQPSDDPTTPIPDDPTRDIVGELPLLFAAKDVALQVDSGSPGIVIATT